MYIQGLINILLPIIYALFVIFYRPEDNVEYIYIGAFCIVLAIICFSKFLIYHRQNMLYFALVFLSYVSIFVYLTLYNVQFVKSMWLFVSMPGIFSVIFYLFYREKYQLNFGVFMIVIGIILLIIL